MVTPVAHVAVPVMQGVDAAEDDSVPAVDDTVHVFNIGHDSKSGEPLRMALTQVSNEKRAMLAFWRFMYEHEAGGDPNKLARAQAELRAQMALAASAGSAGVTIGGYLNGVDGDEHALALVRIEGESPESMADASGAKSVMIVDTIVVTPVGVPAQMRDPLHKAVIASLRALGEMNGMAVRLWTDYDI